MKKYIFALFLIVLLCPFTAEARGGRGGGKSRGGSKSAPRSHTVAPKTTAPKTVAPKTVAPKAPAVKSPASNPTHVKQYVKKNGTVVAPHIRSAEDKTRANNYSTKGNTNPATGKPGTKPLVKPPATKK